MKNKPKMEHSPESSLGAFQRQAKRTAKKFRDPDRAILTWGLGIAGEAGDVASCIKKTVIHKNNQREGIRENIGDTLWYMAMICSHFGWNLEDILTENMKKLEKRYPNGFSHKNARRQGKRVDWNEKRNNE